MESVRKKVSGSGRETEKSEGDGKKEGKEECSSSCDKYLVKEIGFWEVEFCCI